ncbi:uncharacterized protein At4g06598-like isoform X2 [Sesamum indicum]|nr:uncharacterized protein At4g06598-like isoform X2 [Sesamum indicum]XP_020554126.1 uncharacterized protein At4g06598-like isoform X2 [Sesamum indicum]
MEGANGLSNLKTLAYTGRCVPLSPYPFLSTSTSYSDSSLAESKGNVKCQGSVINHHRCSSESFLIEEQPSWLDDLLNESETLIHRGHHRRSASDSYAYLGEAAETLNISEEPKYVNANVGTSTRSQNLLHYKDVDSNSTETKTNSLAEKNNQELEEVVSTLAVEQSRDETSSQNLEGSADKTGASQKSSGSKDSKRAKQHNAHRSRVRKLQYIAHLERTVQILKAEGSEVSAELEFIEQQNMILNMENRALRQRLESISQEQIIKHWEQGMLEREIGRLQTLYHLQKQQQMQLQHHQQQPHNQHSKQRRNRSRDLDHQSNSSTKNKDKDASSSKNSVTGSVRV